MMPAGIIEAEFGRFERPIVKERFQSPLTHVVAHMPQGQMRYSRSSHRSLPNKNRLIKRQGASRFWRRPVRAFEAPRRDPAVRHPVPDAAMT